MRCSAQKSSISCVSRIPPIVEPANDRRFKGEIDRESGRNIDLSEDVMLQFAGNAYVGVIEWWIRNEMPYPPQVMAKQVGALLGRSL